MAFQVYEVSVQLIDALRQPVAVIASHDPDLARQLRRAATSVPLNLREGNRRAGRDRLHLFRVAEGSAAEVLACLEVAAAWRYLDAVAAGPAADLADRVAAMLWRLTHYVALPLPLPRARDRGAAAVSG
jgi:four helix bundle protein